MNLVLPDKVAAVVGLDPAYSGPLGLAVLTKPGKELPVVHANGTFAAMELGIQRWLGDVLSAVCRPGERVVLVAEQDAFGGCGVARKLGIGIGIVHGLLLDLNALEPSYGERGRIDVQSSTWRSVLPRGARHPKGSAKERRAALKAAAVAYVLERFGLNLPSDAAEAVCIATWWSEQHPTWGTHVRPIPPTPTGLKKLDLAP